MYRPGTILDLLLDLGQELELSYIIISHDISVIRYMVPRRASPSWTDRRDRRDRLGVR